MKDLRQAEEYAHYMRALGWEVGEVNSVSGIVNRVFIKRFPLIGGIAKLQRPQTIPQIKEIDKLARHYKLAAFYIEPQTVPYSIKDSKYKLPGFAPAKSSFIPTKTIQISLRGSEEKLFGQMQKQTRYGVRLAQKHGVVVEKSSDIASFIKLWQTSARRRGMWLPLAKEIRASWNAFGEKAHLLFTYDSSLAPRSSNLLAAVLLTRTKDAGYYMYAASTKEGNKLSAPTLLVWEAIKLAKKLGCKIFDFEGIYDARYPQTKSWQGFTKFKEGFGGKIITYPPTLVKYYNPIAKLLNL